VSRFCAACDETPVVSRGETYDNCRVVQSAVVSGGSNSVKGRQQAMWASGDFAVIGTTLQIVSELLNEAVDIRATDRVLDVAAGNGNATLAAAGALPAPHPPITCPRSSSADDGGPEAEGFDNITFEVADAEDLPYANASFDIVLSTFGVMFALDHERAANELMRVCKPGGRIGLATWTPAGFLGQLFRVVAEHVPPIPGFVLLSCGVPMLTFGSCSPVRRRSSIRLGCSRSGIDRRSTG
jgi:SAM-dependent methyltransferase